jgi:hypothetical protein
MKDERLAPAGDVEDTAGKWQETEEARLPDGESLGDIDDVVWDARSAAV